MVDGKRKATGRENCYLRSDSASHYHGLDRPARWTFQVSVFLMGVMVALIANASMIGFL